jgi:hypothetical protein
MVAMCDMHAGGRIKVTVAVGSAGKAGAVSQGDQARGYSIRW